MDITDKFLATERAACATLETRLRNLAERAASKNTFSDKRRPPSHCNDPGSNPVSNGRSNVRPSLFLTNPKLYSGVDNKENAHRNVREYSEKKFGGLAFREISLESNIDDVDKVSSGLRKGSYDNRSENNGSPSCSIPKLPRTPDGKFEFRPKSPFSLEEEDIERVLGLIESLEARNIFLSQNLSFRDAEYKETRTRLEELEDVLTVVNDKDKSLGTSDQSTGDYLLKEQLRSMEVKLIELQQNLLEVQKEAKEKEETCSVSQS